MTNKKQIGIDPTSIAGRAIANATKKQTAEECIICDKEKDHRGPCVLSTAYEKHTEKQTAKHKPDLSFNPAIHKKQTVEEWLIKERNKYYPNNYTDQQAFEAVKMARAEEREKCKYDFDKMFVDAAKDAEEKGRRETAEAIFEEIDKINIHTTLEAGFKLMGIRARFLPKEPKEKEAKA